MSQPVHPLHVVCLPVRGPEKTFKWIPPDFGCRPAYRTGKKANHIYRREHEWRIDGADRRMAQGRKASGNHRCTGTDSGSRTGFWNDRLSCKGVQQYWGICQSRGTARIRQGGRRWRWTVEFQNGICPVFSEQLSGGPGLFQQGKGT